MAFFTNDRSMEIYLLLYMIFTFFFLHRKSRIISTFGWVLFWFCTDHFALGQQFLQKRYFPHNYILSFMDYSTGFSLIFLTLYTIKFEVWKFETSLRQKKEELRNLNTVKDKIFSVIAHDLRTPVHSSIMLLKVMRKNGIDPVQIQNCIPDVIAGMEQTGELLDNLLEWAKGQMQKTVLKKKEISPENITRQTIALLKDHAARKNIRLINEVCVGPLAKGDENSAKVVLRNLMANAIKFTHPGGFIKVSCNVTGKHVNIFVEDNGIGVAPEKQKLLFNDEYYTTPGTNKEMGSGLGLMICRDLASKNEGSLAFSNAPGRGSIFSLSLPIATTADGL